MDTQAKTIYSPSEDTTVASVGEADSHGAFPEADARLLAAAPELLAALQWAIDELCEAWDEPREKAIPAHVLAAIAKATERA